MPKKKKLKKDEFKIEIVDKIDDDDFFDDCPVDRSGFYSLIRTNVRMDV